jgi:predicted nucleic acid-binding protein
MTLFDTNVIIYALNPSSPFHKWATQLIAEEALNERAAVNAISIAEVCVGAEDPGVVADDLIDWGMQMVEVPTNAAVACALAYRSYRARRHEKSGKLSPTLPLPDFFIGAHAEVMGWDIATADPGRYRTYFPDVALVLPD